MTERDSRMLWLRNVERRASPEEQFQVEVELGSEVRIAGILSDADDAILCGPMTFRPDPSGLYKMLLKMQMPQVPDGAVRGTRHGYLFPGGPVGEIVALLSLHFQARFYVISKTEGELTSHGIPLKTEFWPLRGAFGPSIDPIVFSTADRNFVSFPDFLNEIRLLPAQNHLPFALAAGHYARALKEIGVDEEMVFIRLVSAVEAISKDQPIEGDCFDGRSLEEMIYTEKVSEQEIKELKDIFDVRKSKARFVSFLQKYSEGFFSGEKTEPPHTQVTPKSLGAMARAVYDARSAYLHSGDPMYLSPHIPEFPDFHMDPSVGMQEQDRVYCEKQKLPRVDFFHRLVRHCLLSRLD